MSDDLRQIGADANLKRVVVSHRSHGCTPDDDQRSGLGLEIHDEDGNEWPELPMLRGNYAKAADARFIAAAVNNWDALLDDRDALAAMRAENEKLHAFVSWLTGVCVDHDLNTLVRQEIRPALARLREQMEVGE